MNQIINPTVTSQSQYLPTIANDKLNKVNQVQNAA
jgi:hypothetical protein